MVTDGAKSVFAEGATIRGTHTLPDGTTIEVGPQRIYAKLPPSSRDAEQCRIDEQTVIDEMRRGI